MKNNSEQVNFKKILVESDRLESGVTFKAQGESHKYDTGNSLAYFMKFDHADDNRRLVIPNLSLNDLKEISAVLTEVIKTAGVSL